LTKILYIDLDGVVVDFEPGLLRVPYEHSAAALYISFVSSRR
jgi:hypothetical protein